MATCLSSWVQCWHNIWKFKSVPFTTIRTKEETGYLLIGYGELSAPTQGEGPGRTDPYSLGRDNAQEPFPLLVPLCFWTWTFSWFPHQLGASGSEHVPDLLGVKVPPATRVPH